MRQSFFKKKISYGIIGCGNVFAKHAEAITKNSESELAAVFDVDESRAKESASRFGCERKPTLAAMLCDQSIDVVVLCTPHDTHKELILRVIRTGKYCVCEKPLCLSSQEGRAILGSSHYRRNVFVVFQVRFNPAVQFLFNLVRGGGLGKVRLCTVNVRKNRDSDYFEHSWRKRRARVGGILFNHGIHALDLMLQICGQPKTAVGLMKKVRKYTDIEDFYLANVEFENGALGNIEVTTYAKHQNFENSIFVIGDRGSVKIGGAAFDKIEYISLAGDHRVEKIAQGNQSGHERFVAAVNDYLLRRERCIDLPFAEDGMRAVSFIEMLYRNTARENV